MRKKRRSRAFKENGQVIDFEEERQIRREKRKQVAEKKKTRPAEVVATSGRRTSKKMKRRLIFGVVLLIIVGMVGYSVYNISALLSAKEAAEEAEAALEKERDKLKKELSLADSDEYIEEVARDELNMIKGGEKIYVLPKEEEGSTALVVAEAVTGQAVEGTSGSGLMAPAEAPEDGTKEEGILSKLKEVVNQIGENLKSLLRK